MSKKNIDDDEPSRIYVHPILFLALAITGSGIKYPKASLSVYSFFDRSTERRQLYYRIFALRYHTVLRSSSRVAEIELGIHVSLSLLQTPIGYIQYVDSKMANIVRLL